MLHSPNQKIHFVGVGGSGMSGIAEILRNLGFNVSGSDTKSDHSTKRLQDLGVTVSFEHEAHNVHGKDILVVSSAINTTNPEILEAAKLNIPILHRIDMLVELMKHKRNIIVAGTHGKTTTTSILSHVFHALDLDPTAVIGGKVSNFNSNAKMGLGNFFIAEADESDGSFLKMQPHIALITNIDKDHLEYYGSLEKIFHTFTKFIEEVPKDGIVCLCADDPVGLKLIPFIKSSIITYGINESASITAKNIKMNGLKTTFTPVVCGQEYPDVTLNLPGMYNVSNALGSFAVAYALSLDINKVCHAIQFFTGTLHRYTVLAEIGKNLIVDDYAHNPKKIETVLTGTRESFPDKKIVVMFQPHRYTRLKEQGEEFAKAFYHADKVIITPIYSASESPIEGITIENLAIHMIDASFSGNHDKVETVENFEEGVDACLNYMNTYPSENGVVFLILGAGSISYAGHILKERLNLAK